MSAQFKQPNIEDRARANKRALWVEILCTLVIAVLVVLITLSNLQQQADSYASSVEADYNLIVREYTRTFDTAFAQITEKIHQNLTVEEMDAWLKSMDAAWAHSMGEDVYDGICFTYKGSFVRSWDYGDYSNYDPSTRAWYKAAEAANGETAVIAPYVTFLDSQFSNDESYILMSIVKKYNDDIYVDYDVKLPEIRDIMENRRSQYKGTALLLFDEEGYILSSSDGTKYARNIYEADEAISQSMSIALTNGKAHLNNMYTVTIDGALKYLYITKDSNDNYIAVIVSFASVFIRDFLAITLIALFLMAFELHLYTRNKKTLLEYQHRDERMTAVTDAMFRGRLYVDLESGIFYGSKEAAQYCPDASYEELFGLFCGRFDDEIQLKLFYDFVSLAALNNASGNMYKLETQRFSMRWKTEENAQPTPRVIEVGRLASQIDGRETVAITCRDVTEDAAQLKDALKQAEAASHAKGDFMSRMSHEIRTPLNAVIGYLDIAEDNLTDSDKVGHCIEQSRVASRHLLSIINDVLDISSIESGRMKLAHEDFDLTQMINSLTTMFYAQAKAKDVNFEVTVSSLTNEWVGGDSLRVNQVLLNLLSNAVKFTPKKGTIRLDINEMGVHEGTVHMQFKVSDTGIGMSEEYLTRIFRPFEQESAQTAKSFGGTGLGLSISYNLVQMMGGSIHVDSAQGKGTAFIVSLPFTVAAEKRAEHTTPAAFTNLRALVVDDEEDTCEYVQRLLSRCGVTCDAATSGKKALRRVQSRLDGDHPYDFCIVDWNMPGMDGIDVAKEIRALCGGDIPIIIATAYDYSAIADEAKAAGVNKIVSKPLFQSSVFDMLVNTFGKYTPVQAKTAAALPHADFNGMRVILAEDNEMNMEIACEILKKAGMNVTPAQNGKEALDLFEASENGAFEAILMDVQMPIMDGYTATRAIRKSAHPQAREIPIIAMTANAFTSDVTEALAAGMNDHISKPISYERLFAALSKYTSKGDKPQ